MHRIWSIVARGCEICRSPAICRAWTMAFFGRRANTWQPQNRQEVRKPDERFRE